MVAEDVLEGISYFIVTGVWGPRFAWGLTPIVLYRTWFAAGGSSRTWPLELLPVHGDGSGFSDNVSQELGRASGTQ